MKTAFAILIIIVAVLACGCTAAAPSGTTPAGSATPTVTYSVTTPTTPPDLTGTWTGTTIGYDEGTGYTDYGNQTVSMVVTEQHGRIFAGHFVFGLNNTASTLPMAGVIGRDGRTFSIIEKGNGYTSGEIVTNNEIELTYLYDGTPFSVAIDTLKRV